MIGRSKTACSSQCRPARTDRRGFSSCCFFSFWLPRDYLWLADFLCLQFRQPEPFLAPSSRRLRAAMLASPPLSLSLSTRLTSSSPQFWYLSSSQRASVIWSFFRLLWQKRKIVREMVRDLIWWHGSSKAFHHGLATRLNHGLTMAALWVSLAFRFPALSWLQKSFPSIPTNLLRILRFTFGQMSGIHKIRLLRSRAFSKVTLS